MTPHPSESAEGTFRHLSPAGKGKSKSQFTAQHRRGALRAPARTQTNSVGDGASTSRPQENVKIHLIRHFVTLDSLTLRFFASHSVVKNQVSAVGNHPRENEFNLHTLPVRVILREPFTAIRRISFLLTKIGFGGRVGMEIISKKFL